MGHRTLSLALVFRALFLDSEAFEELRDDDNPFVEGLFLVVVIGVITALLNLVGRALAWAAVPDSAAVKQVVLAALQRQPEWATLTADPGAAALIQRLLDIDLQALPGLFGASQPTTAVLNVLIWPLSAMLSWLVYGVLAHIFARLLGGQGSLNHTLGTTALAFTPLLLRGLGFIPFFYLGGVLQTWQLILRYKALRTAHGLPWTRALWATLLPFGVFLAFALLLGAVFAAIVALLAAGR